MHFDYLMFFCLHFVPFSIQKMECSTFLRIYQAEQKFQRAAVVWNTRNITLMHKYISYHVLASAIPNQKKLVKHAIHFFVRFFHNSITHL